MEIIELQNTKEWHKERIHISISRGQVLLLIAFLEIGLSYPDMPKAYKEHGQEMGRTIFDGLLKEGLIIPERVLKRYKKSFYNL